MGLELSVEVRGRDERNLPFRETTRSVNVSGGGLCFLSATRLEVGERLELLIELPPRLRARFGGRTEYRVRALVCRVERHGDTGFRVGARFLAEIAV